MHSLRKRRKERKNGNTWDYQNVRLRFDENLPIGTAFSQTISGAPNFTFILREKDAQRPAADFAVVVHIARHLVIRGRRDLKLLKTARASDGCGVHQR
jgi:hypothetical protein